MAKAREGGKMLPKNIHLYLYTCTFQPLRDIQHVYKDTSLLRATCMCMRMNVLPPGDMGTGQHCRGQSGMSGCGTGGRDNASSPSSAPSARPQHICGAERIVDPL